MVTVHDIQEQIEQLDLQILSLLHDRTKLCAEARRDEDSEGVDEAEMLALWIEEAGDRGMDESVVEKLCKLTILLSRRGQE